MDGVSFRESRGLAAGTSWCSSSRPRSTAMNHASTPIPASSSTPLTPDHSTTGDDGALPIEGSFGQLLLYVTSDPGRFVAHAHDAQKKNACSGFTRASSLIAPLAIAYASRSF